MVVWGFKWVEVALRFMSNSDGPDIGEIVEAEANSAIFANRELVSVGHVPDIDRIVGRDDEIESVARALAPAANGQPPTNLVIYGKTGAGKSLVARAVAREISQQADENAVRMCHTYVDCSTYQTPTKTSRELLKGSLKQLGAGRDRLAEVPSKGIAAADYRHRLWDALEVGEVESVAVVLDEIDKLDGDDVLRSLSRAKESGKTDVEVGIVAISNKVDFAEDMDHRVQSSLSERELIFDSYDADQLEAILEGRRDAFADGALDGHVIPKTAAKAAQHHGDARQAVDTLQEAGSIAVDRGAEMVTSEDVDEAFEQARANRVGNLIVGQPRQMQLVLRAVALLTQNRPEDWFRTAEIAEPYEELCEQVGMEPWHHDTVGRKLKELSFLQLTESQHAGGGRGKGSYVEHRLLAAPETVLQALEQANSTRARTS